jgi:hypothetical protein
MFSAQLSFEVDYETAPCLWLCTYRRSLAVIAGYNYTKAERRIQR